MTREVLECGHLESDHSDFTRGYGRASADGPRSCYACCQAGDLAYMAREGRMTAYLTSDPDRPGRFVISGWPGFVLAIVTATWETSAGGFARGTRITRFEAIDRTGAVWTGSGPGAGVYCRMRRTKQTIDVSRVSSFPPVLAPAFPSEVHS